MESAESSQSMQSDRLDRVLRSVSERLGVQRAPAWLQGMRLQSHPHPTAGHSVLLELLHRVLRGCRVSGPLKYLPQNAGKALSCKSVSVRMTLEPHPLQPGWRSLDSESFGYRAEDTIEAIALHGLTTFCGFHPLELATHPIGLFPAEKEDDPMWKDRVEHAKDIWAIYPGQTAHLTVRCMNALYRLQVMRGEAMSHLMALLEATKITLDNREELVVDLSQEMVEKDLQVEQQLQDVVRRW